MPHFEDWLKDPLSIINNIFSSESANFDQKVSEYFEEKLKSDKNYYLIPSLNEVAIHELAPNCLVRYRCMIQDSFDPVYYTGVHRFKSKTSNDVISMNFKYRETLDCPEGYEVLKRDEKEANIFDPSATTKTPSSTWSISEQIKEKTRLLSLEDSEEHKNLFQRMTFYCVPIPGENDWVKNGYKCESSYSTGNQAGISSSTTHRPSKRGIDLEHETIHAEQQEQQCITNDEQEKQSVLPDGDFSVICKDTNITVCEVCYKYKVNSLNETKTVNICKKTKIEDVEETKVTIKNDFHVNFPLSNEHGVACLVKAYENLDSYKINDMVEFVGILSHDPSLAYVQDEHIDQTSHELLDDQLPGIHEEQITHKHTHNEKSSETVNVTIEKNITNSDTVTGAKLDLNAASVQSLIGKKEANLCSCKIETKKYSQHSKVILSSFPPSLVPRLHCIKSYHLKINNPLLNKNNRQIQETSKLDAEQQNLDKSKRFEFNYWNKQMNAFLTNLIPNNELPIAANLSPKIDSALLDNSQMYLFKLRQELVSCLQEMLLGDALAAEYLLMHLLSSVFLRKDVTILGKFALNLTHIPKNVAKTESEASSSTKRFPHCFYDAYKQFVAMSHLFELSIDTLNKSNMIPNKDYVKNKLITGMLQLPDDFNLVIDETGLNAGELNQKGIMNFNSLKDIVKWQKLNYDFSYHQQEFQSDMHVLVLSEGKSILPADCQMRLHANVDKFDPAAYDAYVAELLSKKGSKVMNNFRAYLSIISKLEYKINQSMNKIIEDDIVNMRKNFANHPGVSEASRKEKQISVEDIHLLMVVARYQSLSYGKQELGLNEWNRAKSIEFERLNSRC